MKMAISTRPEYDEFAEKLPLYINLKTLWNDPDLSDTQRTKIQNAIVVNLVTALLDGGLSTADQEKVNNLLEGLIDPVVLANVQGWVRTLVTFPVGSPSASNALLQLKRLVFFNTDPQIIPGLKTVILDKLTIYYALQYKETEAELRGIDGEWATIATDWATMAGKWEPGYKNGVYFGPLPLDLAEAAKLPNRYWELLSKRDDFPPEAMQIVSKYKAVQERITTLRSQLQTLVTQPDASQQAKDAVAHLSD
jgi:hypothetical protein